MKYILKNFSKSILSVLLILVNSALIIISSLLLIEMLNTIVAQDMERIFWVFGIYIFVWLLRIVLERAKSLAQASVTAKLVTIVRDDISKSILSKSQSEFKAVDQGEYISWYSNDIAQIETKVFDAFFGLCDGIFSLIFSLTALLYFHWTIAVATLVLAVVIILCPKLLNNIINKSTLKLSQGQSLFVNKMKDVIGGVDVLRSYGATSRFMNTVHHASKEVEKCKCDFVKTQSNCEAFITLINIVCQLGINVLIACLSILRIIPVGTIFGGGNVVGTVFGSLNAISQNLLLIRSVKGIEEKFNTSNDVTSKADLISLNGVNDGITVKGLTFAYDEKPIISNMNLSFNKGGKYALVGESGCGKSTIFKLLTKQLEDYEGNILFDETELRTIATSSIYNELAYIPQETFLFNTTIRDNITLGHDFTEEQIAIALEESSLANDINKFTEGLDTKVGEGGKNLSGGQKQRISIARALVHNRSILLLDEATSALDKSNSDAIETTLLKNKRITLLIISHHLDEERKKLFDNIYSLQKI